MTLSLLLAPDSLAADITVTCGATECTMSPTLNEALFNELDVKPGDTYQRTITVVNQRDEDCTLVMLSKNELDPDNFASVLFTALNNGSLDIYGNTVGDQAGSSKNLADLFGETNINLGVVAAGDTNIYNWLVSIDSAVGNDYQSKKTEFDFDLVFACEESGPPPELELSKTNDKKDLGVPLTPPDTVMFILTLTNPSEVTVYNVYIFDAPMFTASINYRTDSGQLSCTDGTNASVTAASSGTGYSWPIGTLSPGESCTLTYLVDILNTGLCCGFVNYAQAVGYANGEVLSNLAVDPFDIEDPNNPSSSFNVEEEQEGEVLGAAKGSVLGAATGSATGWVVLSIGMIIIGNILKYINNKRT